MSVCPIYIVNSIMLIIYILKGNFNPGCICELNPYYNYQTYGLCLSEDRNILVPQALKS